MLCRFSAGETAWELMTDLGYPDTDRRLFFIPASKIRSGTKKNACAPCHRMFFVTGNSTSRTLGVDHDTMHRCHLNSSTVTTILFRIPLLFAAFSNVGVSQGSTPETWSEGRREVVSSASKWEVAYAYSRGVRVGNVIFIAGTVAAGPNGTVVGANDAAAQTAYILEHKIPLALQQLGGVSLASVVRTRMYVTSRDVASRVAEVHGKVFRNVRPASTLVIAQLIEEEYLVEIEVDAIVTSEKETKQQEL